MNLRVALIGAITAAFLCTGCHSSGGNSSNPASSSGTSSSTGGSTGSSNSPESGGESSRGTGTSPLPKGATYYAPPIGNACGIVSDGDSAFPIGCAPDDSANLKFGATNSLNLPDGTGIPTPSGAFLVDGTIIVPIRTGQPNSAEGAILEINTLSGKSYEVDLGSKVPSASGTDAKEVIVGTRNGEVLAIAPQGNVTALGSVGSSIAGVAADERNIWLVENSGSVDWLPRAGGRSRRIGATKVFQREGIAAVGGALWVLTRKGKIQRFSASGESDPVNVSKTSLSLTSCDGGAWVRERSTKSDTSNYIALSPSGKTVGSWNPPAFTAYSACAGSGLWGLTSNGLLYRSPR